MTDLENLDTPLPISSSRSAAVSPTAPVFDPLHRQPCKSNYQWLISPGGGFGLLMSLGVRMPRNNVEA